MIRKKLIMVVLAAVMAWSLVACSTQSPTTTTTPKTTTKVTTTTTAAATPTVEPAQTPMEAEDGTGYLHGTVKLVQAMSLTLEDVPYYEEATLQVYEDAKLVGVENLQDLKPGQKVIVAYSLGNTSANATALPQNTATPEASPMKEAFPTSAKLMTLRVVTSFPTLSGKVSRVTEEGFDLVDGSSKTTHVIMPPRVLTLGMEGKPTMNESVTVIYDDQDETAEQDTVTAISIAKG